MSTEAAQKGEIISLSNHARFRTRIQALVPTNADELLSHNIGDILRALGLTTLNLKRSIKSNTNERLNVILDSTEPDKILDAIVANPMPQQLPKIVTLLMINEISSILTFGLENNEYNQMSRSEWSKMLSHVPAITLANINRMLDDLSKVQPEKVTIFGLIKDRVESALPAATAAFKYKMEMIVPAAPAVAPG